MQGSARRCKRVQPWAIACVVGVNHGSIGATATNEANSFEGEGRVTSQREPSISAVSRPFVTRLLPGSGGAALRPVEGWWKGPLLSVRAVAAHLGVSTATVYKLVASGDLPHARVSNAIRIAPADLEAQIASRPAGRARPYLPPSTLLQEEERKERHDRHDRHKP